MQSVRKGRGACSNKTGRFEDWTRSSVQTDWYETPLPPLKTSVEIDASKSAISKNKSPDLPFDQSINMYRGCEHGCTYCYARPSHVYMGYSAGLDFESKLFRKPDVAQQLKREISTHAYRCKVIALGSNTDPYQPIEKKYGLTREILKVLLVHRHPLTITTKSASVVNDLDLLIELAKLKLVNVNFSVTSLDSRLSRKMEPRASAPHSRIKAVDRLSANGIPVTIFFAPVIPGLNEHEMESILETSSEAGAYRAEWTMIRLPLEVKDLFYEWLWETYPTKASRVRSLIRQVRAGRDNSSRFFDRMHGSGPIAELIHQRFKIAIKKYNLDNEPIELEMNRFRKNSTAMVQPTLF